MHCRCILLNFVKASEISCNGFNIPCVISRQSRKYSHSRNPYDVLGLKKTCSTRDIKKAYIRLCKELHPDAKPGDASQHKKFVELNNAYTTLANSDSRKQFDQKSEEAPQNKYEGVYKKAHKPCDQGNYEKEEEWYERKDYRQYYQQQRYSVPLKHLNNKIIVFGCFALIIIGSIMYFSAYSFATNYTLNKVDERSRIISESYQDTRKNSLDGGRDEQVEKLRRRWNL